MSILSSQYSSLPFRWRLQKAFYHKNCCGCFEEQQCCHCYDIFPGGHCPLDCYASCKCPTSGDTKKTKAKRTKALTLADLESIKPLYISNVVVNAWRREFRQKYCMVSMSPKGRLIMLLFLSNVMNFCCL